MTTRSNMTHMTARFQSGSHDNPFQYGSNDSQFQCGSHENQFQCGSHDNPFQYGSHDSQFQCGSHDSQFSLCSHDSRFATNCSHPDRIFDVTNESRDIQGSRSNHASPDIYESRDMQASVADTFHWRTMHSNWNESIDARTWMPLGSWNSFSSGNRDDFQSRRLTSGIHNTVNTDENKENRRPSGIPGWIIGQFPFGRVFIRRAELYEKSGIVGTDPSRRR